MSIREQIRASIQASMGLAVAGAVEEALASDEMQTRIKDAVGSVIEEEIIAYIDAEEESSKDEPKAEVADNVVPWSGDKPAEEVTTAPADDDLLKSLGI